MSQFTQPAFAASKAADSCSLATLKGNAGDTEPGRIARNNPETSVSATGIAPIQRPAIKRLMKARPATPARIEPDTTIRYSEPTP